MSARFSFLSEIVKIAVIAALIVIPLKMFVFQPFLVKGESMEPNFHNGDYLIVDELSYRFRDPARGEVIVLKFPQDPSQKYIKRIIGLPGETVEIRGGNVFISPSGDSQKGTLLDESSYLPESTHTPGTHKVALGPSEYFVLGDNRPFSSDSRTWGVLERQYVIGRNFMRVISLEAFAQGAFRK